MSLKPPQSLEEVVRRHTSHNDRQEALLASEGLIEKRESMPPPMTDLAGQIQSIIAATERRMPTMTPEAKDEVTLILSQLKILSP